MRLTPEQQALDVTTSPEKLSTLAKQGIEIARLVARNINAKPELLREFSRSVDKEILSAVASNPNTPTDVLWKVAEEFPEEVLNNPLFPLLLLENPNLASELPEKTLESLLKVDSVPDSFIERAALEALNYRYTDYKEILLAVLNNSKTPKNILEKLIEHNEIEIKKSAKLHVNWSGEIEEDWEKFISEAIKTTKLVKNHNDEKMLYFAGAIPEYNIPLLQQEVQELIAKVHQTSVHILENLVKNNSSDYKILRDVIENLNIPVSLIEDLIGNTTISSLAILHPKLPFTTLQNFYTQFQLSQNLKTHKETFKNLSRSRWTQIRINVAENLYTPKDVLITLAQDSCINVRIAVYKNPNSPSECFVKLLSEDRETRLEVSENSNTSKSALEILAGDEDYQVRNNVAQNRTVPETVIEKLLNDENEQVVKSVSSISFIYLGNDFSTPKSTLRLLVESQYSHNTEIWENPCTAEAVLEDWQGDEDAKESLCTAINPETHWITLYFLAQHKNNDVRQAVASKINDYDCLTKLVSDSDAKVRIAVASKKWGSKPYQAETIQRKLANDQNSEVRLALAQNPNILLNILIQLAADTDIRVRQAIYENPSTPDVVKNKLVKRITNESNKHLNSSAILEELANEVDKKIREAVAKAHNTPIYILEKLANDEDSYVKGAVASNPTITDSLVEKLVEDEDASWYLRINTNISTKLLEKLVNHPENRIQALIAEHPNTPINILEKLITSEDESVLRGLVRNANTPAKLIELLYSKYNINLADIARNPNTPVKVLEHLTQNRRLGHYVAENPNVPLSLLEEQAKHHDSHYQNYALRGFAKYIMKNITNPEVAAEWFSKGLEGIPGFQYYEVREVLAAYPYTPIHILEQLTNMGNFAGFIVANKLKKLIIFNSKKSESIIKAMAKYPNTECYYMLQSIARNLGTQTNILEQIAQLEDENISVIAASTLAKIIEKDRETHENTLRRLHKLNRISGRIARHKNTPADILAKIAEDEDGNTRMYVAQNSNTSVDVLQKLVMDVQNYVREEAIENLCNKLILDTQISNDTLQELLEINDWRLDLSVARHPNTCSIILEQLANHENEKIRLVIAQNPNTPTLAIEKLLEDINYHVREAAAFNPNIPQSFLEHYSLLQNLNFHPNKITDLATSQWLAIRERVARHPNTPLIFLEELAKDDNLAVRLGVAQNPSTSINILEMLSDDKCEQVTIAIIANPNISQILLEKLANKKSEKNYLPLAAIKALMNFNSEISYNLLNKYTQDLNKPSFTRFLALSNPLAPSSFLATNFRSSHWLERYAIACNPNTPNSIKQKLTKDANRIVSVTAKAHFVN